MNVRNFMTMFWPLLLAAAQATVSAGTPNVPAWQDFSPSGAVTFCKQIADAHATQNPESEFVSSLESGDIERAGRSFDGESNPSRLVEILVSIGDRAELEALWPQVETVMEDIPGKNREWELPAIAVSCSNEVAAEFLFARGFDPNQEQAESGDFMTAAIVNRDIEMVRVLFLNGYRRCRPALNKDASLPALATRLGFTEYLPLHQRYCGSSE